LKDANGLILVHINMCQGDVKAMETYEADQYNEAGTTKRFCCLLETSFFGMKTEI
jgi:hypothetical protein